LFAPSSALHTLSFQRIQGFQRRLIGDSIVASLFAFCVDSLGPEEESQCAVFLTLTFGYRLEGS
jgi:hypothetical protein